MPLAAGDEYPVGVPKHDRTLGERVRNPTYPAMLISGALTALAGSVAGEGELGLTLVIVTCAVVVCALLALLLPPFDPPDHRMFRLLYPIACSAVVLLGAVVWQLSAGS